MTNNTYKFHFSYIKIILIFLFSVITGFSLSAVCLTGGTLSEFNNAGKICDASNSAMYYSASDLAYDTTNNTYTATSSSASIFISTNYKDYSWNYIDLTFSKTTQNSISCIITYLDNSGRTLGSSSLYLGKGRNLISGPQFAFSKIKLKLYNLTDSSFLIDKIHFRENLPLYTAKEFWGYSAIFSIITLLLSSFLFVFFTPLKRTLNWYCPIHALQSLFIKMGSMNHFCQSITKKKQSIFRTTLLVFIYGLLTVINLNGYFFSKDSHSYVILLLCALLLLLAALSPCASLKYVNWKNPLVASYFIFWLLCCISDFIISKRLPFYGYIMIFLMAFLFFIWSNIGNKDIILKDICRSIEISFIISTIYCLLFRPLMDNYRYCGAYNNPNPYAFYLTIVAIVLLCELEFYLKNSNLKKYHLLWYLLELCAVLYLLFITQGVTAICALFIACMIWLIRNFKYITRAFQHRLLHIVLSFFICMPLMCISLNWGLRNIPVLFDHTITYESEVYADKSDSIFSLSMPVYAAEQNEPLKSSSSRIYNKLFESNSLNQLTSGRTYFYIGYLRNMNLFGHNYRPTLYGLNNANGSYAHNGFLAVAYNYGIFTIIPYFFMLMFYFIYSVRFYRNNAISRYAFLPLGIFVVFFIENMSDNVDTPFHWIVWYIFTFLLGLLFSTPKSLPDRND